MFSYGDLVYAGWGRPVVLYDAMMIKHWDGPYWSEYNPAFGTSRFIPQRFFANDCIWCQDCQSMNENGCCKAIVKGTNVVCQPWQVHLREEFIYLKNPITKWYYKRPKWYRFRIDPVPYAGRKYSGACKRGDSGNG